jgi:hypothetical protein
MDPQAFLRRLAEQLARDLTANDSVRLFTTNTALIGAYAEATVRELAARIVAPMSVSRGSVIYEENCPEKVPEIDAIIWAPCPVPAVFEAGDFAIVPRGSAFGFLEIKSTNYKGAARAMMRVLRREDELAPLYEGEHDLWRNIRPDGPPPRALGVVCLRTRERRDATLDELVRRQKAVILLNKCDDGSITPDAGAMFRLVNFLMDVRLRARLLDGTVRANWIADHPGQRPCEMTVARH